MPADRPVALGYQCLRLDSSEDAQENGRRILVAHADLHGYKLGSVYTDLAYTSRLTGFETLLYVAARCSVAAVIVPSLEDLGRMPRVRQAMQLRLEQVAALRVLVVNSRSAHTSSTSTRRGGIPARRSPG